MSPIERGITATVLIATYGDQAFYKAMELYDAAIKNSDLEDMRRLRRAVMELQERGYSKHPLRDTARPPRACENPACAAIYTPFTHNTKFCPACKANGAAAAIQQERIMQRQQQRKKQQQRRPA